MILPWFIRWVAISSILKVEIDPKYEKIHKWLAHSKEREGVKVTLMPDEYYIGLLKDYLA